MSMMKNYYAGLLERRKAKIDAEGPMDGNKAQSITNMLEELNTVIEDGEYGEYDDPAEYYGVEYENPEDDQLKGDLQKIMAQNDLNFAPDSKEYKMMKSAHKYLRRNYYKDLLAYNSGVTDFSFLDNVQNRVKAQVNHFKPEHRLGNVIKSYMNEIRPNLTDRSYKEQYDCLNYLTDWLGEDFPITKLDDAKAREAKELLIQTPAQRNKSKLTSKRPLLEQIAIAKEHDLKLISGVSVNKYIGYFGSLFSWARNNRYITANPFDGIFVKVDKKKDRRRGMFSKDEVKRIINGLGDGTPDKLIKNKSNYWGALIAVYTGARRNEIAALLPDDVKKDDASGLWYFDITDDEEQGKELKSSAAKRIVPVHSRLIELGFMDFVEESRTMKDEIKHEDGREPRLLYDLTYKHVRIGRIVDGDRAFKGCSFVLRFQLLVLPLISLSLMSQSMD
jgi:integrase